MVSHDAIPEQAGQNGLRIRGIAHWTNPTTGESKKLTNHRQPPDSQVAITLEMVQLASEKDCAVVLPAATRQQGQTTLGQKDFVHFAVRVLLHRGQA